MIQLKMFKIFNDNKQQTLDRLYNLISNDLIYEDKYNVVFLPYQYSRKSKLLINKVVKELDLSKYTLTNEIFYRVFQLLEKNNILIQNISLTEDLDECSQYLRSNLNKLNSPNLKDSQLIINDIINELEWAMNEEDVNIKSIELRLKNQGQNLYFKVGKYGEIDMDYEYMSTKILSLILECLD